LNAASAKIEATSTFELRDGTFTCSTCVPKLSIKADGNQHPIVGSPYVDAAAPAWSATTAWSWIAEGRQGRRTSKDTVSTTGKTLTICCRSRRTAIGW